MSSFYKDLSSRIISNVEYKDACDRLFEAYVLSLAGEGASIERQLAKKLSSSIQYFYLSEEQDLIEEGAVLLSMLLQVGGESIPELVAIAESIFSRSGDFPNLTLLEKRFPDVRFVASFQEETRKHLKQEFNTVEEIHHPLTDYQRRLWEDLKLDNDVITSAPTSTGKTDIVLRYLVHRLVENESGFAAIVVPTRALIAEVAGKIYDIARQMSVEEDIEICTVPNKESFFKEQTFFVMTQERLFEVLQRGDLSFDYLFVDEAHNISDKSRGVLLHLTLQKLLEDSNPQIIVSMPSSQYQNAFDSVFPGISFEKKRTKHSPVAKILMPVNLKGRKIHISRHERNCVVSIDKDFKGNKLANIVFQLGKGERNIVYQNRTNSCEDTARNIAALVPQNKESKALDDAADYVEQFLHHEYSLADGLRKGVAFHYGPLPGVVRTMVENLARDGEIDYIVCTSTLAEGVNLPAKNLFLHNPKYTPPYKPAEPLETVKIDNITGRAGRMLEHFAGNIFLVKPDKWTFPDYFLEAEEQADKIPTYFKVINEDLSGVVDALNGEYAHDGNEQYTYYTIANKLLREYNGDSLDSTINAPELTLDPSSRKLLESCVGAANKSLKVDLFTLEANPTIGFIQQNKLYNFISEVSNLGDWLLPHPKAPELYKRLEKVCEALTSSGIFLPQSGIGHACVIAKKWMCGDSLKAIIAEQISHDKKNGFYKNCNSSVRKVIKVINDDVRFKMSSALRCYHSLLLDVIGARRLDLQSIKVHSFIEVGACDDRKIALINFGLSRETALEIDRVLDPRITVSNVNILRKLLAEEGLSKLHAISRKEIANLLT
jgi:hypothetical protein